MPLPDKQQKGQDRTPDEDADPQHGKMGLTPKTDVTQKASVGDSKTKEGLGTTPKTPREVQGGTLANPPDESKATEERVPPTSNSDLDSKDTPDEDDASVLISEDIPISPS